MASDRIWRDSSITLVLLDTNAVFMIFEFSINFNAELTRLLGSFDIKIPEAVFNEIMSIMKKGKGKQKKLARPALQFIQQYPILSHEPFKNADDAIMSVAAENGAIVVTNDKKLRDRLKEKKISRIFLRGKNRLVLER